MRERDTEPGTFWDHLDALRGCLLKCLAVVAAGVVVAFCLKDWLMKLLMAPCHDGFITYRLLRLSPMGEVRLIGTQLTEQLMVHVLMAAYVGLLVALPFVVWQLARFVAPGLYESEHRHLGVAMAWGALMFYVGTALSYMLLFPLTLRFLAGYSLGGGVEALISVRSYAETLLTMSLAMGLVAEMPACSWLLGRMGLLRARWMRLMRRQAMVAILVAAAIITPTTDALTMAVVALPIYGLYEASIWVVVMTERRMKL